MNCPHCNERNCRETCTLATGIRQAVESGQIPVVRFSANQLFGAGSDGAKKTESSLAMTLLRLPGMSRSELLPGLDPVDVFRFTERLVRLPQNRVNWRVRQLLDEAVNYIKRQKRGQNTLVHLRGEMPEMEEDLEFLQHELLDLLAQVDRGRFAPQVAKGEVRITCSGEGQKMTYHLTDAKGENVGTFKNQAKAKELAEKQITLDKLKRGVEGKRQGIEKIAAQMKLIPKRIDTTSKRVADAVSDMLGGCDDNDHITIIGAHKWEILVVKIKREHLHCVPVVDTALVEAARRKRAFVEVTLRNERLIRQVLVEKEGVVRAALREGALTLSPRQMKVLLRLFGEYNLPRIKGIKELVETVLANAKPKDTSANETSSASGMEAGMAQDGDIPGAEAAHDPKPDKQGAEA